ncbi:hypothetical protein R6Q57_013166 [Mikania cordata]
MDILCFEYKKSSSTQEFLSMDLLGKLSVTDSEEKKEERSARRSTVCSTSTSQLPFVSKTDFVGKFGEIKIKPNDMLKSFEKTFAINRVSKLASSPLTKQAVPAYSIVTKEAGSQLNPKCEPYVPTGSLEQVSSSLSAGHSNCDVKPLTQLSFIRKSAAMHVGDQATLLDTVCIDLLSFSMRIIRRSHLRLKQLANP